MEEVAQQIECTVEARSAADSISAFPTKICTKCGKEALETEFRWRNKSDGKRHSFCKECNKKKDRAFYAGSATRRKKLRTRQKERYKKKKTWYQDLRNKLKCSICGYNKCSYAIEFHHRDPSKKEYAVSDLVKRDYSIERIIKEMEKCDVLCANCHREAHFMPQ